MSPWPAVQPALLVGVLALATCFKPWLALRHAPLQSPWLGSLVLLTLAWSTPRVLPSGLGLHLSGACLLTLMFGWPLACWSLLIIAISTGLLAPWSVHAISVGSAQLLWDGLVPASVSLALGLAMRRWLPQQLFVFILGRAFLATAATYGLCGLLSAWAGMKPPFMELNDWLLGHWLLGWGEAFTTGMLIATFVAFKPEWVLTYSDHRYLPARR